MFQTSYPTTSSEFLFTLTFLNHILFVCLGKDYLMDLPAKAKGKLSPHDNYSNCFKLANRSHKFTSSEFISIYIIYLFHIFFHCNLCSETGLIISHILILALQLFFPIYHDDHWFIFVVAIQDGYFVFLDSFFNEDESYQTEPRSLIVSILMKLF
jgi:hypothetical protein